MPGEFTTLQAPTVLGEKLLPWKDLARILCFALLLLYSPAIHVHVGVWEADGFSIADLLNWGFSFLPGELSSLLQR